jgi:hypothetical protein
VHFKSFAEWLTGLGISKTSYLTHVKTAAKRVIDNFLHSRNLLHAGSGWLLMVKMALIGDLEPVQNNSPADLPQNLSLQKDLFPKFRAFALIVLIP